MTNHMQAAIEAGAQALPGVPANDEEVRLMQNTARAAITAAEPHLRAMIAQEILEEATLANWNWVFVNGLNRAAQIAKGPQQ